MVGRRTARTWAFLKSLVQAVHEALTPFDSLFLTSDVKSAQKHAGLEWPTKLSEFVRLEQPVQAVGKQTALLLSRAELGARGQSQGKARSSTG